MDNETYTVMTFEGLSGADEALHRIEEGLGTPNWEYVSYDHFDRRSDLGLAEGVAAEAAVLLRAAGVAFTQRAMPVPSGIVGEGHCDGYAGDGGPTTGSPMVPPAAAERAGGTLH